VNQEIHSSRVLSKFRAGDEVEVRSMAEILATLDENGELDNLPFMPEMLAFCGRRLTIYKVAHKLCDTISATGLRWMNSAVHLTDTRCDGSAHGGCQTGCLLYWKDAWLKPVKVREIAGGQSYEDCLTINFNSAAAVLKTQKKPGPDEEIRYSCQATELLRAAPLRIRFWDIRQYRADVLTGNVGIAAMLRSLLVGLFNAYQARSQKVLPSWLRIREGMNWGFVKGSASGKTPTMKLDLRPGELVRIRSKQEIEGTLNSKRLNRGLGFEEETARSCGKISRVIRRVDRCIDEKTGRMLTMKDSCVVLDGIVCDGVYHGNCPRAFIPFWREIWLERVERKPE
jgi:hypothetical protein